MTPSTALKLRHIRDTFGVMTSSPRLNAGEQALLILALRELCEILNSEGYDISELRGAIELQNSWEAFR